MASNSFGTLFRITTFGESHGPAIGVIIDGCPAGLELTEDDINEALDLRRPGRSKHVSPRKEQDKAKIVSGIFENITTGAPIAVIIENEDVDSSKYEPIKNLLRPGHANFTYLEKYGVFDYRGGGRSSARETACRVAAGAIASKLLHHHGINITTYIKSIGNITANVDIDNVEQLRENIHAHPIFCPDEKTAEHMMELIKTVRKEGDSIGGIVEFIIKDSPIGLGDPVYDKLEATLAHAMMSIPASKGFELGDGFKAATMKGSEHNDCFTVTNKNISTKTNHAGGTLGGISTGLPIIGRVAFKPTSSILKQQETVDLAGNEAIFQLPKGSRHDPCVTIRAVPVVEAMCALVMADALLLNNNSRLK